MRMVALTEIAEERQPEHVFFCHPFCDADTKTFVAQCARVKEFCCVVDAIPQRLSFVVVLPYKNFCWLQSANVR